MSVLINNYVTQVASSGGVATPPSGFDSLAAYTAALAVNTDPGWQQLLGGPPSSVSINSQYQAFLNAFISYTGAPSNTALWDAPTRLKWAEALAPMSTLGADPTQPSLANYLQSYFLIFPAASLAQAQAQFQQFYNAQITQYGFFNPSVFYQTWAQTLVQTLANGVSPIGALPVDTTNLASGNYSKTLILNRIFSLIASMLNTLQRVAAMQANRLFILTSWQKAYTDALTQMHTFLGGDGTRLSGTAADQSTQRAIANDTINARLQQIMQNNRGVVGDDAQGLQSNVNQSNDTVSQQANMATAIIQELTTLLNAVFR